MNSKKVVDLNTMRIEDTIQFTLRPSFHNASYITLSKDSIRLEVYPRLDSLHEILEKEGGLQVSDFKEMKAMISKNNSKYKKEHHAEEQPITKDKVADIFKAVQKILKSQIDGKEVGLLDGIEVECKFKKGHNVFSDSKFYAGFSFLSPDDDSPYYQLTERVFKLLNAELKTSESLSYLEVIGNGYFSFNLSGS